MENESERMKELLEHLPYGEKKSILAFYTSGLEIAYQAGLEAAIGALPEKQNKTNYKPPSKDKLLQPDFANERIWGWNAYADQAREAIEKLKEQQK